VTSLLAAFLVTTMPTNQHHTEYLQTGLPKLRTHLNSFLQLTRRTDKQSIPEIQSQNIACVVSSNSQSFTNHQAQNLSNQRGAKHDEYSHKKNRMDWRKTSLEQTVSFPGSEQNNNMTTFGQSQCFHLRTPSHTDYPRKQQLQQSISLPAFTSNRVTNIHEHIRRNVKFSNRPLPLTPGVLKSDKPTMQNSFKRKQQSNCQQRKYSEGG